MKKIVILSLIFTVIIVVSLIALSPLKANVVIEDISIRNTKYDENNFPMMYGLRDKDIQNIADYQLKEIIIKSKCQNLSFFKTIYNIDFKYDMSSEIPNFILGNKPAIDFQYNLTPRQSMDYIIIRALVNNTKNYSDKEIIEKLKNTKIIMGSYDDVSGKFDSASKPIAIKR